jgi:hypothetical protein
MIYEIFDNTGAVINRIAADPDFVEANYPGHYQDVTPPPPPSAPEPRIITKTAMMARFTDDEFVDVLVKAKRDIKVEAWLMKFNAAATVDLDDARTVSGIELLTSKLVLTQERATAILTGPVQPAERP